MRPHLMHWSTRAGLVATVLLVAAAVLSRWRYAAYDHRRIIVSVQQGCLWCSWGGIDNKRWDPPRTTTGFEWGRVNAPYNWSEFRAGYGELVVPLWAPAVVTAAATGLGWRLGRRSAGGRCGRCGYDLTGLAAPSPCPECGSKPR